MRKYILTLMTLTMLTILSGCGEAPKTEPPATEPAIAETTVPTAAASVSPEQKLRFSVTEAEQTDYVKEELGGGANAYIVYSGLSEVNINIDGTDVPLAEAVREGKLTLPEIFAFARMDAQNGFCAEAYTSARGLTHFTYTYPQCELRLAYDVYETPDGKQTLINEIQVFDLTGDARGISDYYVDPESKWGYFLDREDWGLTFEAADVSPTRITLDYTQQGGQQIGGLQIEGYTLYSAENYGEPDGSGRIGQATRNSGEFPIPLPGDSSGQITIDWPETAGTLAPGEYYLKLSISDIYDKSEAHPLIVKYHERQSYYVVFSVK